MRWYGKLPVCQGRCIIRKAQAEVVPDYIGFIVGEVLNKHFNAEV